MASNHSELLRKIAAYAKRAGISLSTFGRLAVNDGKLVSRLVDGRRLWPETEARVRRYMEANPPRARRRIRAASPPASGAEAA